MTEYEGHLLERSPLQETFVRLPKAFSQRLPLSGLGLLPQRPPWPFLAAEDLTRGAWIGQPGTSPARSPSRYASSAVGTWHWHPRTLADVQPTG
jgi:hypothetical protein